MKNSLLLLSRARVCARIILRHGICVESILGVNCKHSIRTRKHVHLDTFRVFFYQSFLAACRDRFRWPATCGTGVDPVSAIFVLLWVGWLAPVIAPCDVLNV